MTRTFQTAIIPSHRVGAEGVVLNYSKIYEDLIERARNRTLDGYSERHHIAPRCIGGSDDAGNIARLTPEEHFLAHKLLAKLYPNSIGLALALLAMGLTVRGMRPSMKLVGWARRRAIAAMRETKLGVPRPDWVREKLAVARTGVLDTDEARAKKSASAKLVPHTAERNAKISAAAMGRKGTRLGAVLSAETKEKQRQAALGRKHTAETIAKLTAFAADQTQEQRSARAHKAWQTKRAKAA